MFRRELPTFVREHPLNVDLPISYQFPTFEHNAYARWAAFGVMQIVLGVKRLLSNDNKLGK